MKLSPDTINLLKNFSSISPQIVIRPGNVIRTVATNNTIFASVVVPETFEQTLAIFDLPQFLNVFSMFSSPELDLSGGNKQAAIRDGKMVVRYTFAEPSLLKAAPVLDDAHIVPVTSFVFTAAQLHALMKAVTVLGLPDIYVRGDGNVLTVGGFNHKNKSTNTYEVEVGNTSANFNAIYSVEKFKQLPRDYRVDISPTTAKFVAIDERGKEDKLMYWIGTQHESKFN